MNRRHDAILSTEQPGTALEDRLDLVASVTDALVGFAALSDQMDEAAERVRRALRADACLIRSFEGSDLPLIGCAGMPHKHRKPRIPAGWGILGEMLKNLRPVFILDAHQDPLTASTVDALTNSYRFISYAGAPLIIGGRAIGTVGLYFSEPAHGFRPSDLQFLQVVTNPIALAIENSNLRKALKAREAELELQARERRELDVELLHAQKLGSIGRVAAEVAHDFTNMLSVIIGFNDLAREEIGAGHPARPSLESISAASLRTASLTRQLLAFVRKEAIEPAVIKMQPLIRGTAQMIVPLLGPRITLELDIASREDTVFVDAGQMEHVLVNLMVNARDAMGGAGRLTLRLDHKELNDRDCAAYRDLQPGPHVCLDISDTGCGMTEEVSRRIFEPFFTTKVQGNGTGLGLATCYRAVKQNRGDIQVESYPGIGTTFRILLPRVLPLKETPEYAGAEGGVAYGSETMLVVEGERSVREIAAAGLRRYGYWVCAASTGREALEVGLARKGKFDLLVTEAHLSDMSGQELSARMRARYPHVRTLFVSGGHLAEPIGGPPSGVCEAVVRKPFSPEQLALKVRSVLDGEAGRCP